MGIRISRVVGEETRTINDSFEARSSLRRVKSSYGTKALFLSHKTGDHSADALARHINLNYPVIVYMAEWDDHIDHTEQTVLPDYIMEIIQGSDGFLVNVSSAIAVSMWVGYEIGGAHALGKNRAKFISQYVSNLPSVVDALDSIDHQSLGSWIRRL